MCLVKGRWWAGGSLRDSGGTGRDFAALTCSEQGILGKGDFSPATVFISGSLTALRSPASLPAPWLTEQWVTKVISPSQTKQIELKERHFQAGCGDTLLSFQPLGGVSKRSGVEDHPGYIVSCKLTWAILHRKNT